MAQRTWRCDNPRHKGILAPGRMRADDIRRFCWPCSLETGHLVERHSPALERQRAQAKARAVARSQKKREQDRQRWIVTLKDALGRKRELDVQVELRRALTDMGYFKGWARGHKPTMDDVNVTIRRGDKPHHSGRAVGGGFDVWFTFGRRASYEAGLEIIYHEAAHLAARVAKHDSEFHRILADALQKRWPWIVHGSLAPRQPGGCWEMGNRVIRQMEQRTRDGADL